MNKLRASLLALSLLAASPAAAAGIEVAPPKLLLPSITLAPVLNVIAGWQRDDLNTPPVADGTTVLRGGLGEFRGNPGPGRSTFNTYLDVISLAVYTDPKAPVQVRADLDFGHDNEGKSGSTSVRAQQAYVRWTTELGRGLELSLGRMNDPLGIEGRHRYDNPTIFYSWVTRLTATEVTGFKALYPLTDRTSFQALMFNNLRDSIQDSSNSPGFEGVLNTTWDTSHGTNELGAGLEAGREQPNDNKHWTYVSNAYVRLYPASKVRVDLDGLYTQQETAAVPGATKGRGFAAFILTDYAFAAKMGAYGRYVFTADRSENGAFTGATQSIHQATAGWRYQFKDSLRLRLEYQLDLHKPRGGPDSYSHAAALEVNYRFLGL